jgi:hypothetical protein
MMLMDYYVIPISYQLSEKLKVKSINVIESRSNSYGHYRCLTSLVDSDIYFHLELTRDQMNYQFKMLKGPTRASA